MSFGVVLRFIPCFSFVFNSIERTFQWFPYIAESYKFIYNRFLVVLSSFRCVFRYIMLSMIRFHSWPSIVFFLGLLWMSKGIYTLDTLFAYNFNIFSEKFFSKKN